MEVKPFEPGDGKEWTDFVQSHPGANYCLDLAWKDIIAATYGKEPAYWICREGGSGRVTGVAAAFWLENALFGRKLVALPYLDYGGVLASNATAEAELLAALRWCAGTRRASLELRQERPLEGLPAPENPKVNMTLDLCGRSVEAYWSSLEAGVRDQIGKAERSGVTVRTGREELLNAFYRVFCVDMRDLGSPVHKRSLFAEVLRLMPGAEIVLAELNGWCVGGLFRIRWGDTMAIPWASTLRAYRLSCPNNAIYWDTLAASFRLGCAKVDFGRSTRGAGAWSYKRQWLAKEEPMSWYSYPVRETEPAVVKAESEGILDIASALWSHLPARYANWIGPQIRGAFSN